MPAAAASSFDTKMRPAESKAMPSGDEKVGGLAVPNAATGTCVLPPPGLNHCTRWLSRSATYTIPAVSTTSWRGFAICPSAWP